MKTKIIFGILAMCFFFVIFNACGVPGCMDPNSTNFNSKATEDNGSCNYQGRFVFWWKKPFYDTCVKYGVTNIKIYVDGVLKGTVAASTPYYSVAQACGGGALTVTMDLGSSKSKQYASYGVAVNASDVTLFTFPSNNITFKANTCVSQEYSF